MTDTEDRPMWATDQSDRGASVTVLGSVNMDTTLLVSSIPEAGETVLATDTSRGLGGKGANQAVAAARAGASVRIVGCVGDDIDGHDALDRIAKAGVQTDRVAVTDRTPTGAASVWLSEDHENRIVVLQGANAEVSPAQAEQAAKAVSSAGKDAVLVVQAEIPPATITAALRAASTSGIRTVVNLAPVAAVGDELAIADPLVVNEIELSQIIGLPGTNVDDVIANGARIRALARSVIVTLGAHGAILVDSDRVLHIPAEAGVSVVDSTGAGDAFVGALAAALSQGDTLDAAARFASRCAAAAVGVLGAADSYPDFTALVGPASRKPSM